MSENGQQREADRNVDNVDPDVLLDIPKVSVDSIRLAVDGLDADLSLRARVANLLQVDAGVRVHLSGVELDVDGVHAEAQLRVRLEQLTTILGRALDTLDSNPQIIESLARTATAIDDVNRSAQQVAAGAAEIRAAARRSGGVLDERSAVADRGRPGVAQPGPEPSGPEPSGPGHPGPSCPEPGPVGSEQMAAGSRPGGPGQARPADRRPEHEAPHRPWGERPGGGERPEGTAGRPGDHPDQAASAGSGPAGPGPAGSASAGSGLAGSGLAGSGSAGSGSAGPGPAGDGGGGLSAAAQAAAQNAAQFAEQAGETLRHAGRSVWDAIQGGIVQHRPQSHRDE
ncbi:hypothetical protein [Micromonospora chokoriensis]|uniref:Uncharacterized protein n=1 Tax=Micromonospora chokoriensis TaxID=356851 RepID=A0A1C4V3V2_9ACTN|nr:hypothetical protein [Micromonospora chokoriensis]SCE78521.1 hypothetical protein GA0070612_1035 [Micromonospora chokoriensis]